VIYDQQENGKGYDNPPAQVFPSSLAVALCFVIGPFWMSGQDQVVEEWTSCTVQACGGEGLEKRGGLG
jgi:hypothetical protein